MVGTLRCVGWVLRGLFVSVVLLALVAGLPWALWHYIGWPLPNHVPAWVEVQVVLLSPMSTVFLLDVLACLCWILWTVFTVEVLRCTVDFVRSGFDLARLRDVSAAGPLHRLAGVLVGAVLLSLLGNRTPSAPAARLATAPGTSVQIVAAAPAWQLPAAERGVTVRGAVFVTQEGGGATTASAPSHPESVVVLAPQNGVHDSLSRIAQRTLGDAARWPEIFDLNRGKPQPYGHVFTNPNLIYPGEELALPADAMPPAAPKHPSSPAPAIHPAETAVKPRPSTAPEPSFSWGAELFVGLGLAAAVSAALLIARRRYRARYQPGSGDRDDLPVAPVVYQLRLAHLRAEQGDEIDLEKGPGEDEGESRHVPPPLVLGAIPGQPPALAPGLGIRDGREVAIDLAAARGIGLVGPGTAAAARALLVAVLTASEDQGAVRVVVPADDLAALLGRDAAHTHLPAAVRVVADVAAALDMLEAETLVRAAAGRQHSAEPLVLVARPPRQHERLQAVLDNGAPFGVLGLLLGQWQPGITCFVREDDTISATSPGAGEALRGTRVFRLGDDDTAELLDLLHQADPDPTADHDETELEILGPTPAPTSRPHTAAVERPPTEGGETEVACMLITITVLGGLRVHWNPEPSAASGSQEREITGVFQPRTRELLVLLALHPDGTTRDTLVSALWGDNPPARPTNALHTALSRIRHALAAATGGAVTEIVSADNGRYRLDPGQVGVDYWRFAEAVAARRAATTENARIEAYRRIIDRYGGALAEGMACEWIEPAREAIRRDAIDAVAALARALVDHDPQQTLDLLEAARAFDPHNELLYRDIMRLQEQLGQLDAIPRTLTLLTKRMAEIDET
ncbi:transcriptional regulator, partial [Amycolatopsis rhizosphaerae]